MLGAAGKSSSPKLRQWRRRLGMEKQRGSGEALGRVGAEPGRRPGASASLALKGAGKGRGVAGRRPRPDAGRRLSPRGGERAGKGGGGRWVNWVYGPRDTDMWGRGGEMIFGCVDRVHAASGGWDPLDRIFQSCGRESDADCQMGPTCHRDRRKGKSQKMENGV